MLPGRPFLARQNLPRALVLAALVMAGSALANDYADVDRLLRAGSPAEALRRADAYLAGTPRDPQMLFLRACALADSGQKEPAIEAYIRLTQDYPELPEPYNNLAVLYAGQGQWDKALELLQAAVRGNPTYAVALDNLGDVHARLALQAWARAAQANPALRNATEKQARVRQALEGVAP